MEGSRSDTMYLNATVVNSIVNVILQRSAISSAGTAKAAEDTTSIRLHED